MLVVAKLFAGVRLASQAVGVGHNPDPIPAVASANGGSGYTVPFRIIPERSETPEHDVQSARAKGRDVFDDDPPRPDFADDAEVFEPQAGTTASEPSAASRNADVLAGKTPAYQIDGACLLRNHHAIESGNVIVNWNPWPVFCQDSPAERLYFAEHGGLHAGALQPEAEPADAAEQVKHPHDALPGKAQWPAFSHLYHVETS